MLINMGFLGWAEATTSQGVRGQMKTLSFPPPSHPPMFFTSFLTFVPFPVSLQNRTSLLLLVDAYFHP